MYKKSQIITIAVNFKKFTSPKIRSIRQWLKQGEDGSRTL